MQSVWSCEDPVGAWNCNQIWRNRLSDSWTDRTGRAVHVRRHWSCPSVQPAPERQGWFPAWRCSPCRVQTHSLTPPSHRSQHATHLNPIPITNHPQWNPKNSAFHEILLGWSLCNFYTIAGKAGNYVSMVLQFPVPKPWVKTRFGMIWDDLGRDRCPKTNHRPDLP